MKRTLLALATLMAITLLSCSSNENLTSSAEDLNLSQTPALKRAITDIPNIPIDEATLSGGTAVVQGSSNPGITPNATGSTTVTGVYSMKVTNVPVGRYAWSSQVCYNFSIVPAGAKNVSYEFTCTSTSASGTFSIIGADIECGQYYIQGTWNGYGGSMGTITAFAGEPANVPCCTAFYGQCVGSSVGGGNCNYEMYNCTGRQYYTY